MADISLTASMRSNLLSLQNTQSLMDMTQERLSTGKKVNSAIDNPSSYYTAAALTNRAGDLGALLDSMGQGIQTIKAANEGIEAITNFTEQAKAIASTARDDATKNVKGVVDLGKTTYNGSTSDSLTFTITKLADGSQSTVTAAAENSQDLGTTLNTLAGKITGTGIKAATVVDGKIEIEAADGYKVEFTSGAGAFSASVKATAADKTNVNRQKSSVQYDSIMTQIDQLASDSGYKGVNLLQSNDLKVVFNEDRSSTLNVKGVDASSTGLGLSASKDAWQSDADIDSTISTLENAISTLRAYATDFGNNFSIIQNREEFTESLINVLEEGADKLILADMNEESANMLALQTRQQLAVNSLSLASQAAQSVLKLF